MTRKEAILAAIDDLVSKFLYYDRQEDEDLPRGVIEGAIDVGEITADEIVSRFAEKLHEALPNDSENS